MLIHLWERWRVVDVLFGVWGRGGATARWQCTWAVATPNPGWCVGPSPVISTASISDFVSACTKRLQAAPPPQPITGQRFCKSHVLFVKLDGYADEQTTLTVSEGSSCSTVREVESADCACDCLFAQRRRIWRLWPSGDQCERCNGELVHPGFEEQQVRVRWPEQDSSLGQVVPQQNRQCVCGAL